MRAHKVKATFIRDDWGSYHSDHIPSDGAVVCYDVRRYLGDLGHTVVAEFTRLPVDDLGEYPLVINVGIAGNLLWSVEINGVTYDLHVMPALRDWLEFCFDEGSRVEVKLNSI